MMKTSLILFTMAAAAASQPACLAADTPPSKDIVPHYHAVVLQTLPDEVYCIANGLNGSKISVGCSQDQNRKNSPVTWSAKGGAAEALPGGPGAATAINETGVIVGTAANHATLWKDRIAQDLGVPSGTTRSEAMGVNAKGDVVGAASNASGPRLPFLKSNGAVIKLLTLPTTWTGGAAEHINDAGVVVGKVEKASGVCHAVRWTDGVATDLGTLGGDHSEAQDINKAGVIVGAADISGNTAHACLWRDGKIHDLGVLTDGDTSIAHAVNDDGVIVGVGDASNAAVWIHDIAHNLNDLVLDEGFVLGNATAIDKDGDILAWGIVPGEDEVARAVLLIPEKAAAPTPGK